MRLLAIMGNNVYNIYLQIMNRLYDVHVNNLVNLKSKYFLLRFRCNLSKKKQVMVLYKHVCTQDLASNFNQLINLRNM